MSRRSTVLPKFAERRSTPTTVRASGFERSGDNSTAYANRSAGASIENADAVERSLTGPGDNPGDRPLTMSRSLTYAEIAEALRIAPESANRLARRKRWPRVKGNDGRTRVSVPEEALVRPDSPGDSPRLVLGTVLDSRAQ